MTSRISSGPAPSHLRDLAVALAVLSWEIAADAPRGAQVLNVESTRACPECGGDVMVESRHDLVNVDASHDRATCLDRHRTRRSRPHAGVAVNADTVIRVEHRAPAIPGPASLSSGDRRKAADRPISRRRVINLCQGCHLAWLLPAAPKSGFT